MAFINYGVGSFRGLRYAVISLGYFGSSNKSWLAVIDQRILWILTRVETYNHYYRGRKNYDVGVGFLIRTKVSESDLGVGLSPKKKLTEKLWEVILERGISSMDIYRCETEVVTIESYLGTSLSNLLVESGLRE